jgi:hypothetical protein
MAKLVGTFFHSHGGTTSMPGELWRERRLTRPIREDVPIEDDETNISKANRTHEGFRVLREKIAELETDVLICFSDDQLECFDFNNYPAFAIYVGDEFKKSPRERGEGPVMGRHAEPGYAFKNHRDLAVGLLTGVMKRGFDPAFCMDMPKPDRGIGHAFMRPFESITDHETPVIPILLNCYYSPQITAERCYELGKAVRDIIEEFPSDLKVAVIGSGGLWHTPGAKDAWLNEDFDQGTLKYMAAGDIRGMAEHFDKYQIPDGDDSQAIGPKGRGSTGMPGFGGPQGGTRETCNWIAAAAVADGSTATVVDYVPVYSSPVGAAFAYWDKP